MEIPDVLKELEELLSPNQDEHKRLEDVFIDKCQRLRCGPIDLTKTLNSIDLGSPFNGEPWWTFHTCVLNKLIKLKDLLSVANEKDALLSVIQQKTLKAAVEIVVILGIVNHLPKGIGITLKQRTTIGAEILTKSTDEQRLYSLLLTVDILMILRNDDTIRPVISKHLGDVMAALFALLFPINLTVPANLRQKAKTHLETLVEKEFQPNVVKELMLLHGNPECPVQVSRALRGFLTDRLMQRVGVVATIKAILDLTQGLSSPQHWKTVNILAKLITTPHIKDVNAYKAVVYPQIIQLVYANEVEYMQVAVSCIRQLYEKDPAGCHEWFTHKMVSPLMTSSSEEAVSTCIEGLHNCSGIPCSDNWAIPIAVFEKAHVNIFRLHSKIQTSVFHLKSKVADLVTAIIHQCDPKRTYEKLLFENGTVTFAFGDNGGIKTEIGEEEPDWETAPDLLLETIMAAQVEEIKYKYFVVALEAVTTGGLETKLVSAKLLSELATVDSIQMKINQNPEAIIQFVRRLLQSKEQDVEVACLGLMVISTILDDPRYKRTRDWSAFNILVDPLKEFQSKITNSEVRVLAEQLRSTILSHGVVTAMRKSDKQFQPKNTFDEAMKEAVDKLLPVRAHGLMSLTKLIAKKDNEAWAKQDVLLCLFKENLKEDDSYVYLAAVEGLAVLAATYPDDVLVALAEEYRHSKNSEVRLKVGETLLKVTRLLNEMAAVYKGELISAFLQGSLDDDHLVRASSLSNLGEICKILGFRVHAYVIDILQRLSSVLQTEKTPEPRRAGVMVITLLLQGLGKDTFSTLRDVVLELYRALKLIVTTEKDDLTKLHAELALQELNSCTVNFLMPSQKMEKRIFVLDPLPDS